MAYATTSRVIHPKQRLIVVNPAPQKSHKRRNRNRKNNNNQVQPLGSLPSMMNKMQLGRPGKPAMNPSVQFREIASRMPARLNYATSSPWAACRMNPFGAHGSMGKPDGKSDRFMKFDHVFKDVINLTTANGCKILTFPGCLPFTAIITGRGAAGTSDMVVNGVTYTNPVNIPPGPTGWFPIGVPNEWATTYLLLASWGASTSTKNDPYNSAKARVTSYQRVIRFTGNVTNDEGDVTVTPNSLGWGRDTLFADSGVGLVAGTNTIGSYDNAGLLSPYKDPSTASTGNTKIPIRSLDIGTALASLSGVSFNKDSVSNRLDVPLVLHGKQVGVDHNFYPLGDSGDLVIGNLAGPVPTAGRLLAPVNIDPRPGQASAAAFWLIDESWQGELIEISNVSDAGCTMTIETALCVEYELLATSNLAPAAMHAIKARPSVIQKVHDQVNSLPVAIPVTFS